MMFLVEMLKCFIFLLMDQKILKIGTLDFKSILEI